MESLRVIQRIFREVFDDDNLVVVLESSPASIPDWDSIAQVKIVLALEEEFGFRFTTDQVSTIRTVADLVDSIATQTEQT